MAITKNLYRIASVSFLVRVHLPRELQMKCALISDDSRGHAFDPWWSVRKNPDHSSCIPGFNSICVNFFCLWLSRYFLPTWVDFPLFSLPFLLACCSSFLWISENQSRFGLKSSFLQDLVSWLPSLSQQCITRCQNIWENWNLHEEQLPSPDCLSVSHSDNSFGNFSLGRGCRGQGDIPWEMEARHLVGSRVNHSLPKYGLMIQDVRLVSQFPKGHSGCSHERTVRRRILEGQDGNSGVEWISHQRREFSVTFEESKLQKLLWGISSLFNLAILPVVNMGAASVFWRMMSVHLIM